MAHGVSYGLPVSALLKKQNKLREVRRTTDKALTAIEKLGAGPVVVRGPLLSVISLTPFTSAYKCFHFKLVFNQNEPPRS